MKKHFALQVQLTLEGPILTAGGVMHEPGIDIPMARDSRGRYMLPFSLIKGKVLDALTELNEDSFEVNETVRRRFAKSGSRLREWLGSQNSDGVYEPERGRLRFSDFITLDTGVPGNVIERNQLDQQTGATKDQMLLVIEAPFLYGQSVVFQGKVEFVGSDQDATVVQRYLDDSLRWIPSFGAYRTTGYGRNKSVATTLHASPVSMISSPAASELLPWRLKIDRPLCLVGRKHSQNHFESLDTISGTVLKGSIARLLQELADSTERDVSRFAWGEFTKLRENFSKIRFTEARPVKVGSDSRRPIEPPLSIVRCPIDSPEFNDKYFDVSLADGPRLFYAAEDVQKTHGAAPAFMPDWKGKDFGVVRKAFHWPEIARERRIRTAIDYLTGRSTDAQLFSYGMTLPERIDSEGALHQWEWLGSICLADIAPGDQPLVRDELAELLKHGIPNIGRTRAGAAVEWLQPEPAKEPNELDGGVYLVTLQTECLMTDPAILQTGASTAIRDAYSEHWRELSEGSLSLGNYFARQSLYGGYVSRRAKKSSYEPFLLTDRGSVFVLHVKDSAKAMELVQDWLTKGLPEPKWVEPRYGQQGEPLWQRCPYIRENGYGEICVNLPCHTENRF